MTTGPLGPTTCQGWHLYTYPEVLRWARRQEPGTKACVCCVGCTASAVIPTTARQTGVLPISQGRRQGGRMAPVEWLRCAADRQTGVLPDKGPPWAWEALGRGCRAGDHRPLQEQCLGVIPPPACGHERRDLPRSPPVCDGDSSPQALMAAGPKMKVTLVALASRDSRSGEEDNVSLRRPGSGARTCWVKRMSTCCQRPSQQSLPRTGAQEGAQPLPQMPGESLSGKQRQLWQDCRKSRMCGPRPGRAQRTMLGPWWLAGRRPTREASRHAAAVPLGCLEHQLRA